ncbi:hypothetical protein RUM43_013224 [Polyplax serrata]|uniref:Uncharacterized protein n=1 Tax=Polyplax serrata TaxID=468196 RepID=A0AAN8NWQ5_POLSC
MYFKLAILLAVCGLAFSENFADSSSAREGKFLRNYIRQDESQNKMDTYGLEETKRSEEFAGEALTGMYTDCLAQISFSMNRMEKFSILGNYVSVVRTKNDYETEPEFQARLNTAEEQSRLDEVMESAIDR